MGRGLGLCTDYKKAGNLGRTGPGSAIERKKIDRFEPIRIMFVSGFGGGGQAHY